jgi:hypothetical protein
VRTGGREGLLTVFLWTLESLFSRTPFTLDRRRVLPTEGVVLDVVFVLATIVFFAAGLGYVAVCDRLMK